MTLPSAHHEHDPAVELVTKEEAAEEVEAISPEGRPADAKAGPRALWLEVALVAAVVIGGAIAIAVWIGIFAAIAAFFLGLLALLANPSIGAALVRTKERREAAGRAERHVSHRA